MSSLNATLPVRIAATFTAEPLQPYLDAWLVELGYAPDVRFAPINQVIQQLLDPGSLLAGNAGGYNLVLVRPCDLGVDGSARARSAAREVAAALAEASVRDGIPILLMTCPEAGGLPAIRVFEEDLREQVDGVPGIEWLDPAERSAVYPVSEPFDRESDEAAKLPYTKEMFAALATFAMRRIVALRRKSYKVVAVDCDQTLWSGVCGEAGAAGVVVSDGHVAFQRSLLKLRDRGYLLSLVSKNHPEDVEAVFRDHPGMVIPRDAFIEAMIAWEPKSVGLRNLAKRLNLGLDSILFLDDNPAEIAEVEANAPAVLALQVPAEGDEIGRFLDHVWVLDRLARTAEDAKRSSFYHDEARRRALRDRVSSFEEFIHGLELRLNIEPMGDGDLARASQLTRRTNQFNACPQPRDEAAMFEAVRGMNAELVRASDRFGDYGTVGLLITGEDSGRLWAETFLLSCRALGKGIEQRMLRHLGQRAGELGLGEIAIWFRETDRNEPVREFLESVEGHWEEGVRIISTESASNCPLTPGTTRLAGSANEVAVPMVDPGFAQRVASRLRSVAEIVRWVAPAVRPRPEFGERYVEARTGAEKAIADIWRDLLGIDRVGRYDRFVDLGGSSLDLVRVHASVQRAFGARFDLVRMFEHPTVAAQAKLVEGANERTTRALHGVRETGSGGAVAIVGMAVRLPGANSPEELWDNLRSGVESVSFFGPDELEVPAGEADPDFVCARGLLDPAVYEGVDTGLFGIIPREAEIIDPQQRVFLEICWEALERAGYVPDAAEESGNRVGVYAGCYYDTYLPHHILSDPAVHRRHLAEAQVGALQIEFGNDKDHLATRVAFKLNLRGPSLTVQTACSTSLVAVAHAAMSLRHRQCDMALAGGVTVTVPQRRGYHHEEGGMLSRDGHCRPFDAESSGTVFSNGAGVVLLKRLEDAVRDGDHIHAVIRGFGLNNDGGVKHSYAAPSVEGQADAIRRAHLDAGVDPRAISYVEAHGTATPLGDPIELEALTRAFRESTRDTGFCAIGSLKSNLGHLDTAAGVCGLIKTALSLEHGELPPLLHFKRPNPRIDFAGSPFRVNDRLTPWTKVGGAPRRAGISSFGVGGTNAHVVLEEAPTERVVRRDNRGDRVFVFSGRSEAAVRQFAGKLAAHAGIAPDESFAAAGRTLAVGRKAMPFRTAVVARDWDSLGSALRDSKYVVTEAAAPEPELVWMFPGQGAQHPGMTADLYATEPGYRRDVDHCAGILEPLLGEDLRDALLAPDGGGLAERLKRTVLAQPAIFVVEWALARQWQRWGVRPELMIGHSVGEFAAACLAGVFSIDDGLGILAARGRLMDQVPRGSMLSVRMASDELRARLPEGIDLAASNGPQLSVVAGECDRVAGLARELESQGVSVRELHTSHAFHSHMMDPVVDGFRREIETVALRPPQLAIVSTVTGRRLTAGEATDPGYWAAHLRRTVDFHGAIESACAEDGRRVFLEVGPGQTLSTLARQTAGRRAATCLPSCEHPASGLPDRVRMLRSLGELWAHGVPVDWSAVFEDVPAVKVPLPTYPFQRRRCWIESRLLDRPNGEGPCRAVPELVSESRVEDAPGLDEECQPRLLDRLREVLEDLSGIPAGEMAPQVGFLELGFDSLLLTQAAREVQRTFGVSIAFRDLMQQFPNPGALAKHLEAHVKLDPLPTGGKRATQRQPVALPETGAEEESGVAGPRTRIDRTSGSSELSAEQQKHLADLTARYCAKTRTSKELTQTYRQWHADPRTVNGFNRLWKEMVYQVVASRMKGSRMWDVDGNEYIDMVNGFGPNFLGHSPDFVTRAIEEQLATGLEIGPQCVAAMEASKLFCELTGNERVCFLNTGSEAVQAAMRIARTVTGRDKVLVFDKDYHGNFDPVLVRSVGKGRRRRTLPLAPGIPESAVGDVIVVPWGKPEALDMIREVAGELAAVLVEPVQSRQPELIPVDFVREVKRIGEKAGFLLVFDEVITGLRQGLRGAQEMYGIRADLATYGKVFGGGALPIGIVGGKAEYMDTFDGGFWQYGDDSFPEKEVTFFAGTFVRLPLAMAACRAVLRHLREQPPEYWEAIERRADRLTRSVDQLFRDNGLDLRMVNHGSQMYLRIGDGARHANLIYYHLREKGVFAMEGLPFYLTVAHTDEDVDFVIDAFRRSISELQDGGFFGKPRLPELVVGPGIGFRGPFPMTEPMAEIWLASLLGRDANLAFNEMLQLRLKGAVDRSALRDSVQDLVDRHDALRMRMPDPHSTAFVIAPSQQAEVIEVNLMAEDDKEAAVIGCGQLQRETEFDLHNGPLFRVVVARLAEEEVVLQFVAHHIAVDGWSFEVLIRDFAKCYEARRSGRRPKLLPAPSIVERALREQSRESAAEVGWWRERFREGVPEVELPLRRSYGAEPSYLSSTSELRLSGAELQRLKRLAGSCGATLNSALLAGFQVLLHRLSGSDRFVLAFPSAGQLEDGEEELVGHCVNFLPLLAELDGTRPFRDLVAGVSSAQMEALEHGKVTYGHLLRALNVRREGGRRPLVEIIFNLEPSGDPGSFGGLEARIETVPARYGNATIFLNLMLQPEGLLLSSTYNRELVDEGVMRSWLEAYRELILAAAEDPTAAPVSLPLLGKEARRQVELWSGSATGSGEESVVGLFHRVAMDFATKTAIVWNSGSWTYSELEARAEGVAGALVEAGVAAGEPVGVVLPRGPELIAALLGVMKAGACYLPIEPGFPEARKEQILRDARVRRVVAHDPVGNRQLVRPGTSGSKATLPAARPDDPAYVMYTSGSTGEPKGVVVAHRGIVRLVKGARYADFGSDQIFLQAAPVSFDAATFEIYGALLNGGRLVLLDDADATLTGIARTVRDREVTTLWLTSGLFELMVEEHLDDLRGLKQLLAGGDVLSTTHVRRAVEGLPETRIINGYGPTENTTFTTCHTILRKDLEGSSIPIGRPIEGTFVDIVDSRGVAVPVGVPGELRCGGAGLALGYLGHKELDEQYFVVTERGRMYRTGDLCRWRSDGCIEFVGRADRQVKLRGYRIELTEIEAALMTHPGVRQCKASVRGNGAGGKRLLAWYCASDGVGDPPDLSIWLGQRLPDFMVPDRITRVDLLPLNANGKVDEAALPEPAPAALAGAGAGAGAGRERTLPEGEVESKLATIWCELLGVDSCGREDVFFDLGGNSLAALRMFARIRREFGLSLPLATLLGARTLRALATVIESKLEWEDGSGTSGSEQLASLQAQGEEPPVFAIHGGDGGVLFYRELAERVPKDRPFFAIESPALGHSDAIDIKSIGETAARYLAMVRAQHPQGPYLLAGYSYGGVVAYEMARQLIEAGEQVPFIALFDTVNPAVEVRPYAFAERVSVYWNAHSSQPLLGRILRMASRFRNGVETHLRVKSEVAAAKRSSAAEAHTELRAVQLREAHYERMREYLPPPFAGTLHLFRAGSVNDKFEIPDDYGWSGLVNELRIVTVPGAHLTMFDPGHARALSDAFSEALASAVRSPAGPSVR